MGQSPVCIAYAQTGQPAAVRQGRRFMKSIVTQDLQFLPFPNLRPTSDSRLERNLFNNLKSTIERKMFSNL